MKIAITGASGFVGTRLTAALSSEGHDIIPIGRAGHALGAKGMASLMTGADAVINLAGAPIIARWSEEYKRQLYASRIETTRTLVDAMRLMEVRPRVLVSTSAVGIYKEGDTVHTEQSAEFSDGFLGKLATDWEAEANRADALGVRVVVLRFAIVLSPEGGALSKMLPLFRMWLGGRVGSGRQYISWVHMDDLIGVVTRAISSGGMQGVYNLTAPEPVTNLQFTRVLARSLGVPAVFRVPEFVLRLQFSEGAQVLTTGQRVVPGRLISEGYEFRYPSLESALAEICGSTYC